MTKYITLTALGMLVLWLLIYTATIQIPKSPPLTSSHLPIPGDLPLVPATVSGEILEGISVTPTPRI